MCQNCLSHGYYDYPDYKGSVAEHIEDYNEGYKQKQNELLDLEQKEHEATTHCITCFNNGFNNAKLGIWAPPHTDKRGHFASYEMGYKNLQATAHSVTHEKIEKSATNNILSKKNVMLISISALVILIAAGGFFYKTAILDKNHNNTNSTIPVAKNTSPDDSTNQTSDENSEAANNENNSSDKTLSSNAGYSDDTEVSPQEKIKLILASKKGNNDKRNAKPTKEEKTERTQPVSKKEPIAAKESNTERKQTETKPQPKEDKKTIKDKLAALPIAPQPKDKLKNNESSSTDVKQSKNGVNSKQDVSLSQNAANNNKQKVADTKPPTTVNPAVAAGNKQKPTDTKPPTTVNPVANAGNKQKPTDAKAVTTVNPIAGAANKQKLPDSKTSTTVNPVAGATNKQKLPDAKNTATVNPAAAGQNKAKGNDTKLSSANSSTSSKTEDAGAMKSKSFPHTAMHAEDEPKPNTPPGKRFFRMHVACSLSEHDKHAGCYPAASERLLVEADVAKLTKEELRLMLNEIFARHHYIFKDEKLKIYFNHQQWYCGTCDDYSLSLTDVEKQNVEFIRKHQR